MPAQNPVGEVTRIADFLERELTEEKLTEIACKCSFDRMKHNPMASYDGLHGAINTRETQFLRKGTYIKLGLVR